MRRLFTCFLFLCFSVLVYGQSINVGLTDYATYLYERQMILNGKSEDDFLNLRPFDRLTLTENMLNLEGENSEITYILDENEMFLYGFSDKVEKERDEGFKPLGVDGDPIIRASDKSFLRYFYRSPGQFFQLGESGERGTYQLRINPILHLAAGSEKEELFPFINQRGIQLDMSISDRLYISSNILENQVRFPTYITENYIKKYKAIPGNSFYKTYKSSFFNSESAYDYMNSTAQLGFRILPEIALEFGYGNNHLGHGMRSLILSDFADNYLFLGLDTRIGRFAYKNIFGEIRGPREERDPDTGLRPKKYFATHYLGFKILDNLQAGIFETVVFSRKAGFELHYLNPVILYRTIEGVLGSPDNAMMGLDIRWDILRKYSLYGQFVLDEFKFTELIVDNQDWWANKYAVQAGIKAYDFIGVTGLDFTTEWNYIRPFMYSHKTWQTSWVHHGQALAHPRGSNLQEVLFNVRYRPTIRWDFSVTGMFLSQGISPKDENLGEDPRESYLTRSHDHGNVMLQGDVDKVNLLRGTASYMLWHGAFLDFTVQSRKSSLYDNSTYFTFGFRWNASQPPFLL